MKFTGVSWASVPIWREVLHQAFSPLALGLLALLVPTLWRLAHWVWPSDDQGHGPLVLAVSLALLARSWPDVRRAGEMKAGVALERHGRSTAAASTVFGLGLLFYALGRSQAILMFEVGSLIALVATLLALHHGLAGLRAAWFALFFMLFMIPLPEALVAAVTAPLKSAVSLVATGLMQTAGLPVARAGVMISAGPYQLLVADACAGLNTLFTLEALGLLYLHLLGRVAWWRRLSLALLVVPISFAANVLRVITLTLVTLWWGDAAGQGYAHDFAGLTLFAGALLLLVLSDGLLVGIHGLFHRLRQRHVVTTA